MELILETNVYASYLKCNRQEKLLKMSITFLIVGVLGLFTENAKFQLDWNLSCSANATGQLSEFQCLFKDSAHFKQEGHVGKWAMHFLPQFEAKLESWISHVYSSSQFHQFLLAQVMTIRLTALVSAVSKYLFSWIYPVIRDIWSGKSSQTLCFIEIWNYLSWNETNLDNSIPTLHGKNALSQAHISVPWGVLTGAPVSNKPLIS